MKTRKQVKQIVNATDEQLTQHVNDGWDIIHMEFEPIIGKITAGHADFALCVVLEREVEAAATTPQAHATTALSPVDAAIDYATRMFEETLVEFDDDETGPGQPTAGITIIGIPGDDPTPEPMPSARQQLEDRLDDFIDDLPADVDMWTITHEVFRKRFMSHKRHLEIFEWLIDRDAYNIMRATPPQKINYAPGTGYPFDPNSRSPFSV